MKQYWQIISKLVIVANSVIRKDDSGWELEKRERNNQTVSPQRYNKLFKFRNPLFFCLCLFSITYLGQPPLCVFFFFPVDPPVQKRIPKGVKVAKWFFWIHCEGISRDDSLRLSIHEGTEAVSGWLGSNSASRKILLYEIPAHNQYTNYHCYQPLAQHHISCMQK